MNVDGKALAEGVYSRLSKKNLKLGVLVGEQNPVIDSFVRIKEKAAERLGVELVREQLEDGVTTEGAMQAVRALSEKTDGVIVQLPLPSHIDVDAVLAAIPPEKDVDGISASPRVRPPVAEAVAEILTHHGVNPSGKYVLVVGHGRLVGKPVAMMLRQLGAQVAVAEDSTNLKIHAPNADIVILGAGEPGIVRPGDLKKGVVLIDAGTSETGGKVKGDADPACAEVASVFTPVPGGVGPIAVAMIFKNLFELAGK
jgi:methylenetetrahydrofolate dehydrogenase (NADP+)/methenyltetrahydrofolate cyclohydrolase